ncbi:hypothetical protein NCS56_00917400 [Fusarium sp. Ph1]|nr:hypothetical protein NCS56_00917400 [Fusarium sp. Ph1]
MEKVESTAQSSAGLLSMARLHYHHSKKAWMSFIAAFCVFITLCLGYLRFPSQFVPWAGTDDDPSRQGRLTRPYELGTGVRWMNPGKRPQAKPIYNTLTYRQDGGRWRVMFVCNVQSPCPTLHAEEGDMLEIYVRSDIYVQSSIHLYGICSLIVRFDLLLSPFIVLITDKAPLGLVHGMMALLVYHSWGLNWYIDHTSSASVDGLYGLVYVAPSPTRPRPYHLITNPTLELHRIEEAERAIQHAAIQNHQHRDTV